MEKNFKKAAVNPFVKSNSGGIIFKGANVGYNTEAPTYEVEFSNNGNTAQFYLNSNNASKFEFIRFNVTDSKGVGAGALEVGMNPALDITALSKAYNGIGPDASIEVVYKLLGQDQVLSYSVNLDAAIILASGTINTADALDSDARGAYIEIDSVSYDGGPDETTINVIGAIGLVGYTLEGEVDGNTDTAVVAADGTATIVVSGTLGAGTYIVTVKVTTSGPEYGSFQTATLTV